MKGSCLCGGVHYVIKGELGPLVNCHCNTCRKAHAAAFSSVAAVKLGDLQFESGESLLNSFESSPGKRRYFCSQCGSQIYAYREGQPHYILRLGTLDDDPQAKIAQHIWMSEKAPWYDVCDALPQFDEFPK